MNEKALIHTTEMFVKKALESDSTGHDWYHIRRVRNQALYICEKEKIGNKFIIEMAALLHDIPDDKLNSSKEEGEQRLNHFLGSLELAEGLSREIIAVIASVSYKGGGQVHDLSDEAKVVQDADRLDAIGAMGIARTFAYGGAKGQPMYDPSLAVRERMTEKEYRDGKSSSINHFYEKLLKLKDLLNTNTAREIAESRNRIMEEFLAEFYKEWKGQL
ncbi:HD domain-containing protein [Cytobacillus purgationiresistens]|uniref:HD/PDEase domain-containing protein n=1 Tax=Cytobacillus purgationiresistens TaxID=863449 RepID=A0ABU0ANQ0_9BACI|nr:HD domain-containing protein [Cytobacillus purgationiresistens]MDQ0272028.1 uncharacterized protein [Cytobacillus purgationiresistens]